MSVKQVDAQVRIPPTEGGTLYTLGIIMGEEDGSSGGLVQLWDEDGDEVIRLHGGWAAVVFSGPHGAALLAWVVGELDRAFDRGVDAGTERAQSAIRKVLGLNP